LWCVILRIIDFIRELWKVLKFLLRKIEIFEIQNIFRIPSFTICFLIFFCIFDIFFSILPVYSFMKFLKFLCCFIIWIRDFIKEFYKTMNFFFKTFEIFEIQNFTKTPSFTISYLFFNTFDIFLILFHLSKVVKKLLNFLNCFIGRIIDFINKFWKFL